MLLGGFERELATPNTLLITGAGGSSLSPPTYVGKSEFYVQNLDVVQTLAEDEPKKPVLALPAP